LERTRRGAVRHRPWLGRQTLGLIFIAALGIPFLGDLVGDRALADLLPPPQPSAFRITSPVDGAVLGDGNLVLLEGTTLAGGDGQADRVEVALGNEDSWSPADIAADDQAHWRFLWSDPAPGFHRIRARALGADGQPVVERSIIVQVQDAASGPYVVDNPYATAGRFLKGEIHMHSSSSFDGYAAMPPAQEALAYKRRGYQFVMLTDHDVISYPRDIMDDSFTLLRGYESTSDSGHIVALGVDQVAPSSWSPQSRIDHITQVGGMAILAHPGWQVGWKDADMIRLQGYSAVEIYNGYTEGGGRTERALQVWTQILNTKGWANRIWAIAADDSHNPDQMNRGWIMVKAAQLEPDAIRQSIASGAFYASNGPSFTVLGVLNGAIAASSPDAARIRFIDQNMNVLSESPAAWADYRPSGAERWIRIEAVGADGKTAWSQPFWLLPNAPRAQMIVTESGTTLVGQSLPLARIHVSDEGQYLGSAVANDQGAFQLVVPATADGRHDLWLMATAPWPDQLTGQPTLLSTSGG
jgi:hypothetical protein